MAPMNVAAKLLDRDGVWRFQEIVGVIATPTMRPDGSLLVKQGYDLATRLLLIEPPPMPEIPDEPTRDDALAALALLDELISESPFADRLAGKNTPTGRIGETPTARRLFVTCALLLRETGVSPDPRGFVSSGGTLPPDNTGVNNPGDVGGLHDRFFLHGHGRSLRDTSGENQRERGLANAGQTLQ